MPIDFYEKINFEERNKKPTASINKISKIFLDYSKTIIATKFLRKNDITTFDNLFMK